VDLAIEKLSQSPGDPEGQYYLGLAWAKKAESAPLPTPAPLLSPLPRGATPPAPPEFKNEEVQALQAFEKAVAGQPTQGRAYLALAELLAPHGIRAHEADEARRKHLVRRGKGAGPEPATPMVSQGQDFGPDRVIRAYQMAVRNDTESSKAVEGMISFATRVARLDAAEDGYRELVRREKEKPAEPLVRYGDFLARDKKDGAAAVEQYSQALIWRPDDDETRGKIADIYMGWGSENLANGEYAAAEVRFKTAQKYITDRSSPRGLQLQEYLSRIRAVRDGR
jgi:Tfp pilus assembly protein PilF